MYQRRLSLYVEIDRHQESSEQSYCHLTKISAHFSELLDEICYLPQSDIGDQISPGTALHGDVFAMPS